ncbi:MAG: hypothetical protein ACI4JS_05640 [Oscillospiraceae bacterium]
MIKPTDSKYKKYADVANNRPVIESLEELEKIALERAIANYLSTQNGPLNWNSESPIANYLGTQDGPLDWNKVIDERFNQNSVVGFINMRTFNKEHLVRSTQVTDIFEMQNRLDDYISQCDDPVKKTLAMAVRSAAEPIFNDIIEADLKNIVWKQVRVFSGDNNKQYGIQVLDEDYYIPDDLTKDINTDLSNEFYRKHAANNETDLDELSNDKKLALVSRYVKSFFDREAMEDVDFEDYAASEKDFLNLLKESTIFFTNAALKGDKNAVKQMNEREARDFKALSSAVKAMSDDEKSRYRDEVGGFKSGEDYAGIDVSVKHDHLDLTLINSPMIEITADEFLAKQKEGTLSPMEIEWGEASVDAMVKSLYTDDEYRALVRAGYDPAMGIIVDGKPLDWFKKPDFKLNPDPSVPQVRNTAKLKCDVVGKALSGSKIDVYKFVPDGINGFKKGEAVSVKTDLSMKYEERGFFRWLLEFLHIIPSVPTIKEIVEKGNKENRDYLKTAMPVEKTEPVYIDLANKAPKPYESDIAKLAKRDEAATRIIAGVNKAKEESQEFDKDFFSDVFGVADVNEINTSANNAFGFNDYNILGKDNEGNDKYHSNSILDTMHRQDSRVNLAILYGMTCGHSFDEMIENSPEGAARRKAAGRAFVEEFSVDDYTKFIGDNKLENNNAGKKAYLNYVYDKKEKLEKFTLRGVEAISREPVIRLDPFDHTQFSANYNKYNRFASMVGDFYQSVAPLKKTAVVSTPETKALTDRSAVVFKYMESKIYPILNHCYCARAYGGYMRSKAFVVVDHTAINRQGEEKDELDNFYSKIDPITVNLQAEAKAALDIYHLKTVNCNTYADIMFDEEMNISLSTLTGQAKNCAYENKIEPAKRSLEYYLPSENRDISPIVINEPRNEMISHGFLKNFLDERFRAENAYEDSVDAMKCYIDTENVLNNGGLVSEAFDKIVEEDNLYKQFRDTFVTFDNLVNEELNAAEAAKGNEAATTAQAAPSEPQHLKFNDIAAKPKVVDKQNVEKNVEKVVEKKPPEKSL